MEIDAGRYRHHPALQEDCPYLFPGRPPTRPVHNIKSHWTRIRDEAGLRLHDLRHTWASVATVNGVDRVTIAKLLGHALVMTTERYAHLSNQSVTEAADRVSARLSAALDGTTRNRTRRTYHARSARALRPDMQPDSRTNFSVRLAVVWHTFVGPLGNNSKVAYASRVHAAKSQRRFLLLVVETP